MIRFIDLSDQICEGEKEFAFFNTTAYAFLTFSGNQVWDTKQDFIEDYNSDSDELNRYLGLIPDGWE